MYNHRKLYKVICVETKEGAGTEEDLARIVQSFYTEQGQFLGVIDPKYGRPQECMNIQINNPTQ